MASFNLGSIKGIKGDVGPKGDKGDKGDTGSRGERGTDGITPVFSIGGVTLVDASLGANVEIDSSDVANPKLYFSIPKGRDGKDSLGDMCVSVYDTQGKKQDFYTYADDALGKALLKTGGNLLGKLSAYESESGDRCVRNIYFLDSLPETAANGDICFLRARESSGKLSEHSIGSELILTEDGVDCEYIVADKNFHTDNSVTLVRKYFTDFNENFDYNGRERYQMSDIDICLENFFWNLFSDYVKKQCMSVKIDYNYPRHCFLPSVGELTSMNYFKNYGLTTTTKDGLQREYWMTRDTGQTLNVFAVKKTGEIEAVEQNRMMAVRPMIILPSDLATENIMYGNSGAIRLTEEKTSMYLFENGQWKELKS